MLCLELTKVGVSSLNDGNILTTSYGASVIWLNTF